MVLEDNRVWRVYWYNKERQYSHSIDMDRIRLESDECGRFPPKAREYLLIDILEEYKVISSDSKAIKVPTDEREPLSGQTVVSGSIHVIDPHMPKLEPAKEIGNSRFAKVS